MEFIIKQNEKEFNDGSWKPGDRLYLNLSNKERYRSIINLLDNRENKRFSTHSGSENIDFGVTIPQTNISGVWNLVISQNNETEKIPIDIIGLRDLKKTVNQNKKEIKEVNDEPEEDLSIDVSKMSMKKIQLMLHELDNDEQLSNILHLELTEDQTIDLNIPIAEIESIDRKYYNGLKEAGIDSIAQILTHKPIEIKQIADAPMDEIQTWYSDLYAIYKKKNHRLKKEYRIIRSFNDAKDEELSKIKGTSKAEDTIDVLSGVSDNAKEKLNEIGIINVIDILEYPLDNLTKVEVDQDKPLLWKTWLANAKSHFGIH